MPAIQGLIVGAEGRECETNGIFLCAQPNAYMGRVEAALSAHLAQQLGVRDKVTVLLGARGAAHELRVAVVPQLACDLWISYSPRLVARHPVRLGDDFVRLARGDSAPALWFTRPEHLVMVNRKQIHHVTVFSAGLTKGVCWCWQGCLRPY